MSNAKLDKYKQALFKELDESSLTDQEKEVLIRYRRIFTLCLEKPFIPDVKLRDYLMNEFRVNESQAYRDIGNVRILLGNVANAGKEWIRYIINETLKRAIDDAMKLGKNGIKLAIMAADRLAKYNRLDREDGVVLPWDQIVPQSIEPTTDPTVLGIKPLENKEEVIRRMYEKYRDEIEIEDVDFEPVEDGRKKEGLL